MKKTALVLATVGALAVSTVATTTPAKADGVGDPALPAACSPVP
jgi:hypothetical protein